MPKLDKVTLNSSQQAAVDITDGPALVVAGAGTGKTKVIVERIARLIRSGVDKQQILALTFTDKAAQEMLDRVGELLEQSYGVELNIFTFNAFGQELLREFAIEIGQSPNMQLIGDTGKVVLLRDNLDELALDYFSPISTPDAQLGYISDYFSQLKQQLVKPAEYLAHVNTMPDSNQEEALEKQRHTELANAFKTYLSICRARDIIDYDDQLYLLIELLEQRPNILKQLQQRYRYILVDEFQDTNPMQSCLLDLLAQNNQNIMAVGDDDQSIYGWRGATLANILEFKQRYPQAKEIALTENFRSTQAVLNASYQLIQHNNPDRLEVINGINKQLHAHRGDGPKPQVHGFSQFDAELNWVAKDIARRIASGTDPGSIAVLTRRNSGVQRMHTALDNHGIEHTVAGVADDIYRQPVISTMIEALKTVTDPHDDQALYHTLCGALFKLDAQELGSIGAAARRTHQPLYPALQASGNQQVSSALKQIAEWRKVAHELSVRDMSYKILDQTGLKAELLQQALNDQQSEFAVLSLGRWFQTLNDFAQVSTIASPVNYLQNLDALKAEGETITDDTGEILNTLPVIMSVHKAKGLEWSVVYIIDCSEHTFPLRRTRTSLAVPTELSRMSQADDHYSEERRLMYVATTRARDQLILTHSETHNGTTKRTPSRFLLEMQDHLKHQSLEQDTRQIRLELFSPNNQPRPPITLPAAMLSGDNLVLSASQVNDYLRCPLDFKYRHILNVPPEPNPASTVGTLFHGFIQQIHEAKLRHLAPPTLDELIGKLNENWPQEGYHSSKQRERAQKIALAALKQLHTRLMHEPPPLASEEPFRVHIPNSRLILKGRVDAVIGHSDGVEVRDYKTATTADTPAKAKRSAQSSKQLEMYALAWRLKHGELPIIVSLDFVQTQQVGQVKKQAKTIDRLEQKLAEIAENILIGKFLPGHEHRFCRHSD